MVSKRKAKKLAKQGQGISPASNPNGVHSGDVTGEEKQKPIVKEAKHIIGFGQKSTRLAIHAISNVDNSALCDHRQKGFVVNPEFTTKDCICKTCRTFGAFKALQEVEKKTVPEVPHKEAKAEKKKERKDPERIAEEVATAADKKAAEKKVDPTIIPPAKAEKPKPGPEKKKEAIDETEDDFATLKSLIDIRFKRLETRLTKKLHGFIDDALLRKPEFFLVQNMSNKYGIVHESSRLVIVDNILEDTAKEILPLFLNIVFKWNGQDKMPKEWVSAIKDIIEKVMPKAKAAVDASKPRVARKIKRRKPIKKDKPRKIKRRPKEPKRVIKRRSRH
jgi:hypothetical protein